MELYPEILVEGGVFKMGGEEFDREMPIHEVTLDSFWMGKYLLTFDWFDRFCQETERPLAKDFGWGREQRPAIMVSWFDTIHFCNWLSRQHSLQEVYEFTDKLLIQANWSATGYRLPTEAEWEYAARGGIQSKNYLFAGGNTLRKTAWHIGNARDKSQLVGEKLPNELGIFDMSGNVWEWCWDWFDENYYKAGQVNPKGPDSGTHRIIRGGSWYDVPNRLRVSSRLFFQPGSKISSTGIRLARNVV